MKLSNISLLLVAVTLIAAMALCLFAPAGLAQNAAAAPSVGPTAYLPGTVQTRNVSTPAPVVTTAPTAAVTTVPVVTVTPVPAARAAPSARMVNYGTSSDTFKRGERATGFVTIKNTGNMPINDVTATVSANVKLPVVGSTGVGNKDYTFNNLNIQPGETKRIEFAVDIPSEYKGISTAGDYDLHVTMKTGGKDIGSFTKSVKVT
ncbi:MAG TPA: hypothetical protein VGJ92_04755 [Methanocella sp.]|jgi:hypothetical protein